MKEINKTKKKRKINVLIIVSLVIFIAGLIYFLAPSFTSFVIKEEFYADVVNIVATTSGEYVWSVENSGELKNIKIDGSITKTGKAKVYIENEGQKYLIFDNGILNEGNESSNESIPQITAFAVKNENNNSDDKYKEKDDKNKTEEKKLIEIRLKYNSGTQYDENNDGEESIFSIIDLSVNDTEFNLGADKNKACTRWEIYNLESENPMTVCYGNSSCCAYIGLLPKRGSWNEPYYASFGKDGTGHKNIMSAQVIYAEYNTSGDNLYSNVISSEWSNLTVNFYDEYNEFSGACLETCNLSNFNKSSYKIIFEMENATLRIDKFIYSIEKDIPNNPPVLLKNIPNVFINNDEKLILNLSAYFSDTYGDKLKYHSYSTEGAEITINEDVATITANKDDGIFNSTISTYITANDGVYDISSNIFDITVISVKKISDFIILNSSNNTIFKIDENGDLFISGSVFENQENISPSINSFVAKNFTNYTAAFVNEQGNLFLGGSLYENSSLEAQNYRFEIRNSNNEVVGFFDDNGNLKIKGNYIPSGQN